MVAAAAVSPKYKTAEYKHDNLNESTASEVSLNEPKKCEWVSSRVSDYEGRVHALDGIFEGRLQLLVVFLKAGLVVMQD